MKLTRRQRGGTIAEAAFALPILFLLLFAILEFGRAWNLYQTITNAAREGARYSVAPYYNSNTLPTATDVQTQVQYFLNSDHVHNPTVTVNQTYGGSVNGIPTVYTQITVTAPYTFLYFPFGTINLTTEAVMRNETN